MGLGLLYPLDGEHPRRAPPTVVQPLAGLKPPGPYSASGARTRFVLPWTQPKAYAYAKEVMSMNARAADAQEGIAAFLGKRPACWTGK
jgi:hypothetical protein